MSKINTNEREVFDNFPPILDKYITKKVYEIINNLGIECSNYGIVSDIVADDNGNVLYANVDLPDGTVLYLSNKTGENLYIGDTVKIYGSRTNLSNRYIGVKCITD